MLKTRCQEAVSPWTGQQTGTNVQAGRDLRAQIEMPVVLRQKSVFHLVNFLGEKQELTSYLYPNIFLREH